ncbi:hypothetical protein [Streptomyces sp. NPDC046939]|uniref:SCO4225 family membrane protein n=1 Tax=Streptomyces sp. NPDC046939 TaxID=3155376 RepID=UPI0033FC7519
MNVRTVLRLTFANAASAGYLGLVGASVAFEAVAAVYGDSDLVGIWPFLLTAPTSVVAAGAVGAVWGVDAPVWYLAAGIVVSALIQSFVLGALLQAARGTRRRRLRPRRG